jgi:hypothetical protein
MPAPQVLADAAVDMTAALRRGWRIQGFFEGEA